MSTAADFAAQSVHHLREEYLPRLAAALEALPSGDHAWRPHAGVPSVGILLRHLEGNVRQWILSGLAGAPDHRDRASEFAADVLPDLDALHRTLCATVRAACDHVGTMDAAALAHVYEIQGFRRTGLAAVYHVVEHFAWHVGQITWIAKARAGAEHGIAFYDDAAINRARNREGSGRDAS